MKYDVSILNSLSTKASMIRYLGELKYTTSQIVKILNENGVKISYQHVNNESIRLGLKTVTPKENTDLMKIRIAQLEKELEALKQLG